MGADIAELVVKDCKASEFADCDVVFSGLDAEFAGEIGIYALDPVCRILLTIF